MSDNNQQPRPSIRIGSSPAQCRILEEETGPSSSPLTTDPASVPPSSVEASALPEATLSEGSTPKEDNSLPEDSVPMEGSSPPQDSVPVEGDNPHKDSVPSEGRSPSLVSYDDEDVEDSVAPLPPLPPSQLGASEVPPSPLPGRSSEVPPSPSIQSRETVQPSLTAKEGLEDQPSSSSKKAIEVPSSSLPSSSEVPPSHSQQLLPAVPTVRRTIQNPAVPTSGSPLTTSTVRGVNNLSVSPPQARDSTPSTPNFPSHLSEEQRKKETGEVSKKYLERYFHEDRIWKLKNRLERELQARRGTSSTLAKHTPSQTSSYASSSIHHGASRQHNPYARYRDTQVIPEDPEAIPPTEMSNKRPPFYGPKVQNDLRLWISPRIGPFLTDKRITPETSRNDPEPTYDPRPGVRFMRTTREGVFRRFAGDEDNLFLNVHNPCPYPRFSPGDYRTGWWFTETTYGERLFLYDRRPDHIASYCGPDHRRTGNLQRALQQVTVFPGCVESRMLKWVMVEGRIEKTRLVQPAMFKSHLNLNRVKLHLPLLNLKHSKRGGSLPQSSSQAADVQCNFCKQKGHPSERCPSEDCQRSKKWREQQAQQQARGRSSRGSGFRSRRGTRGRGRGSSYNKRSRHYLCTLETIPPTTTTQPHTESSAWKDSLINPLANLEPTKIPNSQANFFSEQADLNGHDSDTIFMVQYMNHNCLQLNFLINNVEVKGIIDSGATCSVVTEDVISNCNMARSNETISYKIADGTTSQSLGTASGTLSIRLGSVTQIVHVKHKFSIVPGHETILIGADLLSHLGLMNNKGIYIRMDDACRTLLLPEAEFDNRISQASEVVNVSTR
ncbi:hypothetical protein P9112_002177 [Eukaryota sp. TZLM1-RC]